jgi:heat shock protein HspQ
MFLRKQKYLLRQHKTVECDGVCVDIDPIFGVDDDSSDDEMASNKYAGSTEASGSDFHARLLADTATRRKLKDREAF